MRVIIAGSRGFNDYTLLETKCTEILTPYNQKTIEIISGGANGADTLGERFAHESHLKLHIFPAQWATHGKSAGYKRNQKMAEFAAQTECMLIAFWDEKSVGTKHMINTAQTLGIRTRIIRYKGDWRTIANEH